jgi:thiol-disulfide isomerase/thioredoxin
MNAAIVILLYLASPTLAPSHVALWCAAPWIASGEYRRPQRADHFAEPSKMVPVEPLAGAAVEPPAPKAAPAAINWVSLEVARASGKPIWLHVAGKFCAPCRALESGAFRDPRLIAASRRWACVAMDATDTMQFRTGAVPVHEAMDITTVPRDVFVLRSRFQMAAPSQPCPRDAAGYVRHLDEWWSKSQ